MTLHSRGAIVVVIVAYMVVMVEQEQRTNYDSGEERSSDAKVANSTVTCTHIAAAAESTMRTANVAAQQ